MNAEVSAGWLTLILHRAVPVGFCDVALLDKRLQSLEPSLGLVMEYEASQLSRGSTPSNCFDLRLRAVCAKVYDAMAEV